MPAAKPRRKINRTRANANENSLRSHNHILVIRFRMAAGRRSLFDRSAAGRPLEKSAEARLEFIGIPPRVVGHTYSSQICFDSQRVAGARGALDTRGGKRRPFLYSLITKFCWLHRVQPPR